MKRIFNKRIYRYLYLRLVRQSGTPEYLATSFAMGVFLGIFIPMGLQMFLSLLVAVTFRLNKFLTVAAVWITNPLTVVPIYSFIFWLGSLILRVDGSKMLESLEGNWSSWEAWSELGLKGLAVFFTGSFIVGVVSAAISYFVTLRLVRQFRRSRVKRLRRKINKEAE